MNADEGTSSFGSSSYFVDSTIAPPDAAAAGDTHSRMAGACLQQGGRAEPGPAGLAHPQQKIRDLPGDCCISPFAMIPGTNDQVKSDALVFFGATGDLAYKKNLPGPSIGDPESRA